MALRSLQTISRNLDNSINLSLDIEQHILTKYFVNDFLKIITVYLFIPTSKSFIFGLLEHKCPSKLFGSSWKVSYLSMN